MSCFITYQVDGHVWNGDVFDENHLVFCNGVDLDQSSPCCYSNLSHEPKITNVHYFAC